MSHLRCHLLIGPSASGKSTLATTLAALLCQQTGRRPRLLSTDAIRVELCGDSTSQASTQEIHAVMVARLQEAVANNVPVIMDATHANRASRLAITQALDLPSPVEWVGWWLTTPLETCLQWNSQRAAPVPDQVIRRQHSELISKYFSPRESEGFAILEQLDASTTAGQHLQLSLLERAQSHEKMIAGHRNRTANYQLHGYSRLLDLERLYFLIRLLSRFPNLEAGDESSNEELRQLCNPLPSSDDPAERAAACLRQHGDCYADAAALRVDLAWLKQQGFMNATSVREQIIPPEAGSRVRIYRGCWPATANREAFVRIMTLLRHVLQNPFDMDRHSSHLARIRQEDREGLPEDETVNMPVSVHLIEQLRDIPGSYIAGEITRTAGQERRWRSSQSDTLLKDLQLLRPYGLFQNGSARAGYALGTALLTMPRLLELNTIVRQVADRLADPSIQDLQREFADRLAWAGYPNDERPPVRAYANRSIVGRDHVPPGSLAVAQQADRLSEAILKGYGVQLQQYEDAALFEGQYPNVNTFTVWPLQILFHNIGWYLAYEEYWPNGDPGLIRTQRLDRLKLVSVDAAEHHARTPEKHRESVRRLDCLLDHCAGIFFGYDREAQLDLCASDPQRRSSRLTTLSVRCTPRVFTFLREGVQRFPSDCTRFSKPLDTDRWRHRPKIKASLDPVRGDSHPYPVEYDLPDWMFGTDEREGDVDLKRWLFGFDDGILIIAPAVFRNRRIRSAQQVLQVHQQT